MTYISLIFKWRAFSYFRFKFGPWRYSGVNPINFKILLTIVYFSVISLAVFLIGQILKCVINTLAQIDTITDNVL